MAGLRSIIQVNMRTYKRQSLKSALILVIFINIALFALFLITEHPIFNEFNYSTSLITWYLFFVTFLLALVSSLALRAITNRQLSVLLIFMNSNIFLLFTSSAILIFLRLFQPQFVEYLTQQDLRSHCPHSPPKSVIQKKLELLVNQEFVRIGWEIVSILVAINYYKEMIKKPTISIIYTIPQQFISWEDETYTKDRSKSISTSVSQYRIPPYVQLI